MKNKTIILICLLIIILTFTFANSVAIKINVKETNASPSCTAQGCSNNNSASSLGTKVSDENSVSVSVTPDSLDSSASTWNFTIGINTHSGSLDADLAKVSELIDDQGKSYKPLSWEGSAPGGHHRNGVLKFNSISPKPESIELKIKNVGGVPERRFKWSL